MHYKVNHLLVSNELQFSPNIVFKHYDASKQRISRTEFHTILAQNPNFYGGANIISGGCGDSFYHSFNIFSKHCSVTNNYENLFLSFVREQFGNGRSGTAIPYVHDALQKKRNETKTKSLSFIPNTYRRSFTPATVFYLDNKPKRVSLYLRTIQSILQTKMLNGYVSIPVIVDIEKLNSLSSRTITKENVPSLLFSALITAKSHIRQCDPYITFSKYYDEKSGKFEAIKGSEKISDSLKSKKYFVARVDIQDLFASGVDIFSESSKVVKPLLVDDQIPVFIAHACNTSNPPINANLAMYFMSMSRVMVNSDESNLQSSFFNDFADLINLKDKSSFEEFSKKKPGFLGRLKKYLPSDLDNLDLMELLSSGTKGTAQEKKSYTHYVDLINKIRSETPIGLNKGFDRLFGVIIDCISGLSGETTFAYSHFSPKNGAYINVYHASELIQGLMDKTDRANVQSLSNSIYSRKVTVLNRFNKVVDKKTASVNKELLTKETEIKTLKEQIEKLKSGSKIGLFSKSKIEKAKSKVAKVKKGYVKA